MASKILFFNLLSFANARSIALCADMICCGEMSSVVQKVVGDLEAAIAHRPPYDAINLGARRTPDAN
jgi:hypothetical protein